MFFSHSTNTYSDGGQVEHRGGSNPRMLHWQGRHAAEIGELPTRNLEAQSEGQPSSHPSLSHSELELH